MSNIVIKVENLTKEYHLGIINHGLLFRDLQSWWAKLRGKEDPNSSLGPILPPPPPSSFINKLALPSTERCFV